VIDSTRVTIFGDSTRVTLRSDCDSTRSAGFRGDPRVPGPRPPPCSCV